MFFVPGLGIVVSILTFPGVIVHETAHLFFCRLFKVPVYQVCFFRVGNPAGFVIHGPTESFAATFFISLGPFFINTLLCILFCTAAFLPVYELKVFDPLGYFFYWLGISIGMHSFPSDQDATHVWDEAPKRAKRGNLLAIVSLPLTAILVALSYGRVIWADLWYGLAVGIFIPIAIFKALIL
jgi:hypothetical protein